MIRSLLLLAALLLAPRADAQDADPPRAAIEAAMADSAAGWNSGDLDRFLAIYADAPTTSFVGEEFTQGLATIRGRYLERYPDRFGAGSRGAGVGRQLSFDFVDFRMLGANHALLIARWRLSAAEDAPAATGMTSLVFERAGTRWKVVADHSS